MYIFTKRQEGTTTGQTQTDTSGQKYYAVKKGRCPGIYESWTDCREQVHGYSGAVFKSFKDRQQAVSFLQAEEQEPAANNNLPIAFIDGSYSQKQACYGYGGYIEHNGQRHIIQGTGNNPAYLQERNIAGELIGALQILFKCSKLGIKEINLYHDYTGIKNYLTGDWTAKTPLAVYYKETAELLNDSVILHCFPVKGHTGIQGNEIADLLAKEAIGATLRKKDIALLQDWKTC